MKHSIRQSIILQTLIKLMFATGTYHSKTKVANNFMRAPFMPWIETNHRVDHERLTIVTLNYDQVDYCDEVKQSMNRFFKKNKEEDKSLKYIVYHRLSRLCTSTVAYLYLYDVYSRSKWSESGEVEDQPKSNCSGDLSSSNRRTKHLFISGHQEQIDFDSKIETLIETYNGRRVGLVVEQQANSNHTFEEYVDGSKLAREIRASTQRKTDLLNTIATALKREKVPIAEFSDLIGRKDWYKFDGLRMVMKSFRMNVSSEYERVRIQMVVVIREWKSNNFIFKAEPFKIWTNLTQEPTHLIYSGPEFVIHNSNQNCTKGIENPTSSEVCAECYMNDYFDERIHYWTLGERKISLNRNDIAPVVRWTHLLTLVYCPFQQITINEETFNCPIYPFYLKSTQTFNFKYSDNSYEIPKAALESLAQVDMKAFNDSLEGQILYQDGLILDYGNHTVMSRVRFLELELLKSRNQLEDGAQLITEGLRICAMSSCLVLLWIVTKLIRRCLGCTGSESDTAHATVSRTLKITELRILNERKSPSIGRKKKDYRVENLMLSDGKEVKI